MSHKYNPGSNKLGDSSDDAIQFSGSLYASGSVIFQSASTPTWVPTNVSYDMATKTGQISVNGTRGLLSLTFDGTLANGASTGSFSIINPQIDTNSMFILYPYASTHAVGVIGLSVVPYITADNLHVFYINNASGVTIANDVVLQLNYIILR